jgi:hypothetical protein
MFSWFHHEDPEEEKKVGEFSVSWYLKGGPLVPSQGTEISGTGLVFITSMPPPDYKDFNLEFEIRGKRLHAHVQSKKPELVSTPKGMKHQFVCKFVGIAADDWDLIVRHIKDMNEVMHEGAFYDPNTPDDEFRSLPTAVQKIIIDDLVNKERLEAPPRGIAPLIRMTLQGQQRTKEGKVIKKFMFHSRVVTQGEAEPADFDTKYSIDDTNTVVCLTEVKKKK